MGLPYLVLFSKFGSQLSLSVDKFSERLNVSVCVLVRGSYSLTLVH